MSSSSRVEEGGDVDEQPAVGALGGDVAHPDRRISEAVAHPRLLGGGAAGGAEARIFDLGDDLAADPAEDEDPRAAGEAAVEADRRRAEPGLQRGDVDEARREMPSASGAGSDSRIRPPPRSTWTGSSPCCAAVPLSTVRRRIDGEGRGGRGGEEQEGEAELHGRGH